MALPLYRRPPLRRRDLPCCPRPAPLPAPGPPGSQATTPEASAASPPEPPSGPIRPGEPIPSATLAEHLRFNAKSRMQLMRLGGRVVQVRGPVGQVEPDGAGAVLHLGSARGSCVRARFADAADLKGVRRGREVEVVGTLAFRGDYVLLEDARLGGTRPHPHGRPTSRAAGAAQPPSEARTSPTSPGRPVCAPGAPAPPLYRRPPP
jgi:hypothetical protein